MDLFRIGVRRGSSRNTSFFENADQERTEAGNAPSRVVGSVPKAFESALPLNVVASATLGRKGNLDASGPPSHLTSLINPPFSPSFSSITTPTFLAVPRMACVVALTTDVRVIARGSQRYILFTLLTFLHFSGVFSYGTFSFVQNVLF
jgi:hypothetical protein